jgi:riboflavin kinase/FMN adenylyltransferase
MDVIDDLTRANLRQETVLTIGAFDGVHRGHQALIGQVVARARASDRLAALITFYPHPAAVLAPERAPLYLTTPGEKLALLEALGVDLVALLSFTRELAATPGWEFMEATRRHLRVRELWAGPDFTLGQGREGTLSRLRAWGEGLGFEVHALEPAVVATDEGLVISSSRIRALLAEGRVDKATQMLGRHPSVSGEVVAGAHRGQGLGFPTANLDVRRERALPADGVYAAFAVLGAARYPAVVNVGRRPSFDHGERIVEVHLLDGGEDLYGCDLVVEFVARIRDEVRFARIEDLVAQIGRDCQAAREILSRETQDAAKPVPMWAAAKPGCSYRYEEVEHTADRALWVWGQRMSDLFVGAARGMYRLMAGVDELAATQWRVIHLEALDREALLVAWLNELLFLTETEHVVFADFSIGSLTDTTLTARVGGTAAEAIGTAVKAATFHGLELLHDDGGWSATITFDA